MDGRPAVPWVEMIHACRAYAAGQLSAEAVALACERYREGLRARGIKDPPTVDRLIRVWGRTVSSRPPAEARP